MTKLQAVIAEARVSPQAAHIWQKASDIADAVIEDYIQAAKATAEEITVTGLLAWARRGSGSGTADGDPDGAAGWDDADPPTHACPTCGLIHVALPGGDGN